jgi:hypothetical protein
MGTLYPVRPGGAIGRAGALPSPGGIARSGRPASSTEATARWFGRGPGDL